jgi:hypothetical protein
MKRLFNFLRFLRLAPPVDDVTASLYPESDRRHRAVPTSRYVPDISTVEVEPYYVRKQG